MGDVEAAVTATNPRKKKRGRKRRSNGDGTVWPERNGFRWQITLGYDQNGKRITVGDSCPTRAEAEAALILARADRQRKLIAEPNRITVAEYAQVWLNRQYSIQATTRIKYQTDIGYALNHIGRVRVQDVTTPMLKEMLAALARVPVKTGRPLAMRSISKVATRLRAMFGEAVDDKIVYANPMHRVKTPQPEVNEVAADRALTFDQEARLIEVGSALYRAGMARLWPAIYLMVRVGLRRGEVMGLRWSDLNVAEGELTVRRSQGRGNKKASKDKTKTVNSRRVLPLAGHVIELLLDHQRGQEREREAGLVKWEDPDVMFATTLGSKTHPDNANRALANLVRWSDPEVVKKADVWKGVPVEHRTLLKTVILMGQKLPRVSPHDLRHTFGTLAIRRGMSAELVSKYMGHANVIITLSIYRHVVADELRAAAKGALALEAGTKRAAESWTAPNTRTLN